MSVRTNENCEHLLKENEPKWLLTPGPTFSSFFCSGLPARSKPWYAFTFSQQGKTNQAIFRYCHVDPDLSASQHGVPTTRQDPLASTSAWSAKPTPRICDPDPQCPSGRQLHLPDDPPAMRVPQYPLFQNMPDPHGPYNSQGTSANLEALENLRDSKNFEKVEAKNNEFELLELLRRVQECSDVLKKDV
ncbi:hypothetical protein PGB90_001365 [Kerria lacca]